MILKGFNRKGAKVAQGSLKTFKTFANLAQPLRPCGYFYSSKALILNFPNLYLLRQKRSSISPTLNDFANDS